MTIIYSTTKDILALDQYSKGPDGGYRRREGFVNIYVFDNDKVHIDPINNRISADGEYSSDTFSLSIDQAEEFAKAILDGVKAYREEFASERYDEYEEARYGGSSLTATNGWDPEYPETSLVYDAEGNCLGRLMSVDPEAIRNNPAIQEWSKPAR